MCISAFLVALYALTSNTNSNLSIAAVNRAAVSRSALLYYAARLPESSVVDMTVTMLDTHQWCKPNWPSCRLKTVSVSSVSLHTHHWSTTTNHTCECWMQEKNVNFLLGCKNVLPSRELQTFAQRLDLSARGVRLSRLLVALEINALSFIH